jgi:colicin import membrane protein
VTFWQELGARLRVLFLAIAVHALAAALIVVSTMNWQPFRKPKNLGLTIEAVMVDTSEIRKQRDQARQAAEREKLREERDERLKQQREREQEKRRQEELEQQQKDEAEKLRQEELEAQRKRDAREKLERLRAEQENKAEEDRKRRQEELEKLRIQREEAEKKQRLEAERLKQLENQRLTQERELERQREEDRLQEQLAEEERQFRAGQVATLGDEYEAAIRSFVTQNWLRPPTAQPGLRCKLRILQIPGGEVISAGIRGNCNGDEATRRSIVAAVERGGSLPYRGFEEVFAREIEFIFIYDGD